MERDMFVAARVAGAGIGRDRRFASISTEANLIYLAILPAADTQRLIPESPSWIAEHALSFVYDKHNKIPLAMDEWLQAGITERRAGGMLYLTEIQVQEDAGNG